MKQVLYLLLAGLFVSQLSFAQVTIQMEESGGVYRIPCIVNGAKMKMIFDTGASNICLSEAIAEYLLDSEYISKDDFIGTGKSQIADGRIVNNLHLLLRDIEIGGLHLTNVEAVVIEGQQAPLLLGLSAINKLGRIEIDGDQLLIYKGSGGINSQEQVNQLSIKGYKFYTDGLYAKATECFDDAYALGRLNSYQLYYYVLSSKGAKQYDKALRLLEWIDADALYRDRIDIYSDMADVYYLNNLTDEAIAYYKKSINSNCTHETRQHCYSQLGFISDNRHQYKQAEEYFLSACAVECMKYGYKMEDLVYESFGEKPNRHRTDIWDEYYYYFTIECSNSGRYSNKEFALMICKLAKYENHYAKDYCNRAGIDYIEYLR